MKVYIDLQKLAISKVVDATSPEYQGDINSNVFEILFFNFSGTNWYPTMSQLAPNGREAGDFEADTLGQGETHDYTENGVSYKRYTFTMGDTWVLMKGRSNLYVWYNVLEGSTLKKCVGKLNVMINESSNTYFISNPLFNPAVKNYIDNLFDNQNETIAELSQGTPSVFDTTAHIQVLQENKGVAVATDTGYIWYWDTTITPNAYVNSGVQYLVDTNYDELSEDVSELIQTRAFNVNANGSHSGNADRIITNMYSGEVYVLYIESSETTPYFELRAFTDLSTSVQLLQPKPNQYYKLILNTNYVAIGLYVSNTTANIASVKYSLVKINSALDKFIKLEETSMGLHKNTFYMNGTSSHSSNADRVLTNFSNGKTIYLYLECDDNINHNTTDAQFYLIKNDNTNVNFTGKFNTLVEYTLTFDIVAVGVYIPSNTNIVGNTTLYVFTDLSIFGTFVDYKANKLDNIVPQLGVFKNSFTLNGTSAHSSGIDRIETNLYSGTKLYLYIESDDNLNHNSVVVDYFFVKNDNTTTHYQTYFNTIIEYTLPNDIKAIGVYVSANSGITGKATFYVYTDLSLLGRTIQENNSFIPFNYNGNVDAKLANYYQLLKLDSDAFQYLFFTDPHILGEYKEAKYKTLIDTLKNVFIRTSCEFLVSGGDWLTANDTQDVACKKLSTMTGLMYDNFGDKYLPILGNHDTNYQGVDDNNNANAGILPNKALKNILFPENTNMYYTLKKNNTRLYVFDSGTDWNGSMNLYKWGQINWFATQLLNNNDEHITLFIHIFTNQSQSDLNDSPIAQPLAENITLIAQAFNNRTSITLNGITYNFSNVTGTVNYLHCGHTHYDANFVYNDIPVVITRNTAQSYPYSFDVCYVDYDNSTLHLIRIGTGTDRTISF